MRRVLEIDRVQADDWPTLGVLGIAGSRETRACPYTATHGLSVWLCRRLMAYKRKPSASSARGKVRGAGAGSLPKMPQVAE